MTGQDAEATLALDMGQPLHAYQQQSHMSSMGSLPGLPALTTAQAGLAGPGMGYMPSMAPSFPQASMMQQPQSMTHVLSNYMQMVQWQQVCQPQLCACLSGCFMSELINLRWSCRRRHSVSQPQAAV